MPYSNGPVRKRLIKKSIHQRGCIRTRRPKGSEPLGEQPWTFRSPRKAVGGYCQENRFAGEVMMFTPLEMSMILSL